MSFLKIGACNYSSSIIRIISINLDDHNIPRFSFFFSINAITSFIVSFRTPTSPIYITCEIIAEGSYDDRLKIERRIPRRCYKSDEKEWKYARACARLARGKSRNSREESARLATREHSGRTVAGRASCCFNKAARVHERKAN